ncbi:MAG: CdaR family protein [Chloroflexota bacterium]|nr:CdaR family protein [Chloroflexota bacterium]
MTSLRTQGLRLLLSIGLAFALWIFVSFTQNPDQRSAFEGVPVDIEGLAPGLLVVDKEGLPKATQPIVTISVEGDVVTILPVRQSDLRAFVDLSGLAAGEHSNVPVIVERNRAGLARLTLTSDPAFLSFRLEQEITRTVPLTVEVTGSVPFSFEKGKPRLTQAGRVVDSVLIRGPQSRVDRVDLARVVADIDRLTGNYSSTRPVEILSQDGQEIAGVTAEPSAINVQVPIASSAGVKRVPVVPRLVGAPASGQIVSTVSVDPQFIQLTGGSDALDGIESIETFDVDIAGVTRAISRTVAMHVPANTSLASGEPAVATVLVEIRPIDRPFQITLPVPIQVTDQPDGLLVTFSPISIQIKLEGNAAALGAFDPASLQGTVSARTLGEGTYAVIPSIQLPRGVTLVEPAPKVTVTLRRPPTPQPTVPADTATPAATPAETPSETPLPTAVITTTQTISGTPTTAPVAAPTAAPTAAPGP